MRRRTLLRLRTVGVVALATASIGSITALAYRGDMPRSILAGAFAGALSGVLLTLLEMAINSRSGAATRRLPFTVLLLGRGVVYGIVVPVVDRACVFLISGHDVPWRFDIALSFVLATAFNFVFLTRRHIGSAMFANLITGRYHQPRSERRLVMFLDLKHSTKTAEEIGDRAFLNLLNDIFFDVGEVISEFRGEIYRYVGDEVIATWTLRSPLSGPMCRDCAVAVQHVLATHTDFYRQHYGFEPRMRCAIHAGGLVVGEVGDAKREIMLLGDTMNTAARIEGICRSSGHDIVASGPALSLMQPLPPGLSVTALGAVELRGRKAPLPLFALEKRPAAEAGFA
ncbi:adenylate/guanylate cyclase domain-containing protein [Pseudoxanthobacter sp.]|uniref:adenylate/guanylate cyclase domain-containing protein n=1 Tax=Pseudoxanthobacter sp. TaxID=1925742 RepID=UPI002FE25F59